MGYNHQRIKANARTFYKNNSGRAIIVVLIFGIITAVISGIYTGSNMASINDDGEPSTLSYLIYMVLVFFVSNILIMGLQGWFRRAIYETKQPGDLFEVFKTNYMGKVGTMALKALYIWLWSLLFVIPGIIKTYEYSMVDYIKEENPNIPAHRCFELSKTLTNGHKGDLFYLDISFLGWWILTALTWFILGVLYVGPYYYSARAFAYEELKAEAAAAGKIDLAEITGYTQNFGGMTSEPQNFGGSMNNGYGAPNMQNNNYGDVMPNNNNNNSNGGDSSIYYTPKE